MADLILCRGLEEEDQGRFPDVFGRIGAERQESPQVGFRKRFVPGPFFSERCEKLPRRDVVLRLDHWNSLVPRRFDRPGRPY